jgi:hypothetical protein
MHSPVRSRTPISSTDQLCTTHLSRESVYSLLELEDNRISCLREINASQRLPETTLYVVAEQGPGAVTAPKEPKTFISDSI